MLWISTWLVTSGASAGDLSCAENQPEQRSYKIEAYRRQPMPGGGMWSSDWRTTDLVLWSGIIHCTRTRPRVDDCTFDKGFVVFGQHIEGEEKNRYYRVPLTATLNVRWKSTQCAVSSWRFVGEREDFWQVSTQAFADRFHKKGYYKPDAQRELGALQEESLALAMLGAMEFELPKTGDAGDGWKVKTSPSAARMFRSSTVGSKITAQQESRDGDIVTLHQSGRGSESLPSEISHGTAEWTTESRALFDVKRKMVVQQHQRVTFTRQFYGYYLDRSAFLAEATADMTAAPGELSGLLPEPK